MKAPERGTIIIYKSILTALEARRRRGSDSPCRTSSGGENVRERDARSVKSLSCMFYLLKVAQKRRFKTLYVMKAGLCLTTERKFYILQINHIPHRAPHHGRKSRERGAHGSTLKTE